jgi:hypothetical protein
MPKRQSKKIKLLEHHSSSSSSCSSSESDIEEPPKLLTKPSIGPIESCSLISKVRMFLPVIAQAELPAESCDPELMDAVVKVTEELDPEHGVEMDISLGVFDVAGEVSEGKLADLGIPIVNAPPSETLIQEL